jgi:sialic acid synthase SpsE
VSEEIKSIDINGKPVGDGCPVFIIAEIGSNHCGDLEIAKRLIKDAASCGVDAVKFQSFAAETLVNRKERPEAYNLLKSLEVPDEWHRILKEYAESLGVTFLSAPFDFHKADLLESLDVSAYKIASGELTNLPFLEYIALKGKPIILSAGMATIEEIEEAINSITGTGNHNIIVMHCVVSYPTGFQEAHIRALPYMKNYLRRHVGYSDHSPGHVVPLGAVALGACMIEKHITFHRNAKGPDHSFALEIPELRQLVIDVRNLELSLGTDEKIIAESELQARIRARKGIYSQRLIRKGEIISHKDIIFLRPSKGMEPKFFYRVVGKVAKKDIEELSPISETCLETSSI